MRWYKYLLVFLLSFIFVPLVNAETCSNSEIVKYQELAKNVDIYYDYEEIDGGIIFKVKISNMQPGLIVRDTRNDKNYIYTDNTIEMSDTFYQGNGYRFDIYSDNPNCSDKIMFTRYVTLPYYNNYYNTDICKGIEEFKYCQRWTKTRDYDFMNKEIAKYKNSLNKEKKEDDNTSVDGLFDIIFKFYLNYYYIILPIIIIPSIIFIYKYNKKNDLF